MINWSEKLYTDGVISFGVVETPEGKKALLDYPIACATIGLTSDQEIILVRQYRTGLDDISLEIPAGKSEPGETPLQTAQREFQEETGFTAGSWLSLARWYPAISFCNEELHLFLATDLKAGKPSPDADENLQLQTMLVSEFLKRACSGEFPDSKTQLAGFYLQKYLSEKE